MHVALYLLAHVCANVNNGHVICCACGDMLFVFVCVRVRVRVCVRVCVCVPGKRVHMHLHSCT